MAKRIAVLDLKPTQLALGMLEVKMCVAEYASLGRARLKKLVRRRPISVVIGPNGLHYMVDGHHHACAFWLLGIKKLPVTVIEDYSSRRMHYSAFWRRMKARRWTHLYDQFGRGPHDPLYLPQDIRGLGDDPYRSLAWLVRTENGYNKTDEPFVNFRWANFFRSKKILHCRFEPDFKAVKGRALKIARSPAARRLPGYQPGA